MLIRYYFKISSNISVAKLSRDVAGIDVGP